MSTRVEIVPNCSLTPRGALVFFLATCGVSFALAGALALQGFWPVLPFAGLEMLVLGWALSSSLTRRYEGETIVVTDAEVDVVTHSRKVSMHAVFPRHWARVRLVAGFTPLHPSRLSIESHGRRCEIASFLTEQERRHLAARLGSLIGRVADSPPLPSGNPKGHE